MKYLTFLFILSNFSGPIEIEYLNYKNPSLEEKIVKVVYDSIQHYPNIGENAILLNINQIDDGYEIKVAGFSKEAFKWYLIDKKDKLFGFSYYKEMPIIVFGNGANNFFSKTKNKNHFNFLETKKIKSPTKSRIPEEPLVLEALVWVYIFEDDSFKLLGSEWGLDILN